MTSRPARSAAPYVDPTVTEPIPVLEQRPRWRDTVSALRAHNYRLYLLGQVFANSGGWMARIAIDWLVLELTGNVALVGLAVTLQFAPTLLLGPWAGVLSDRFRRHTILIGTQSVGTVANGVLAALVLTGVVQAWHVFVIAAVTGTSMAIDGPSRSAFVAEMVGTHRLRNAISMNATIFHLGGLLGPAISGVLIVVVGSGWSIAINATTSLVAVTALVLMRRHELLAVTRAPSAPGQIREALRYLVGKPTILFPMIVLASVAIFGMNLPVLFTASANEGYHTGAAGYGLYSSLAAVGAFAGAILSTRRRALRLRAIVLAAIGYGLVTVVAGLAPWYPLFLGALVGIGVTRIAFATGAESLTQLSTNLAIRGRIMSFYLMTVVGGQALGGVIMGAIAETFGPTVAFVVAGGVPALTAMTVAILLARRGRLALTFALPWRGRPVRITPRPA
ncbi:MFS transporter [Schumannella soli]|uniref:MFS transporter n=1 Tax=Schumannella soli TaxID=2590779 RepID=A0A506Y1M3_9MICO|nr:MFS transporter [Schumannella soli]TPW75862.1 MFS transporter [Schumannella soli]